jgi:hypothetical protein
MPKIDITTRIAAPPERCFDLSRDLDLHLRSMGQSGERAIAGRTSGMIELGARRSVLLVGYLTRLLETRNRVIERAAELLTGTE